MKSARFLDLGFMDLGFLNLGFLDLGTARVVGDMAQLPAKDDHVQIDASSPHTIARRAFAEIPIGGASNGSGQITAAGRRS